MSFVGSMFDNSNGAGFKAGSGANLTNPVMGDSLQKAQDNSESAAATSATALGQQQAFVNALQGQNGIANQNNVYSQLQGVANGTGPNPAQAMLAQSTGQNIASQGALMAGQRGSGSNAGLLARQAAMQGGGLQQQAAGQAANMQAQQSMGALNQMSGIAGQQIGNQGNAVGALNNFSQSSQGLAQGEQNNLMGAQTAQNANSVNNASQQNNSNVQIAKGNQAFQAGAFKGAAQGIMQAGGANMFSSMMGATGGEVGKDKIGQNPVMMADGGGIAAGYESPVVNSILAGDNSSHMPDLGQNSSSVAGPTGGQLSEAGPSSDAGKYLSSTPVAAPPAAGLSSSDSGMAAMESAGEGVGEAAAGQDQSANEKGGGGGGGGGMMSNVMKMAPMLAAMAYKGGRIPAILSPGERYLSPDEAEEVTKGKKQAMKSGKEVPGKAKVKGDSLKNDVVPAKLEEGGIVIPRSVTQGKDAQKKAQAFVAAHFAKAGKLR